MQYTTEFNNIFNQLQIKKIYTTNKHRKKQGDPRKME